MCSELGTQVNQEGFAVIPGVFSFEEVQQILTSLESVSGANDRRRKGGMRNLLESAESIRYLATSPPVKALVTPILGPDAFPVRAILFDKVPEANWKVPWHQDLSIAVCEKIHIEGFGPWSTKAGILHVQPPVDVLENMLAVRVHLDECDESNGPVRVIPRTHIHGRIPEGKIESLARNASVECLVSSGGVLLMKPLLLHASSPAQSPKHRRVIHIEYASMCLPGGLRWSAQSFLRSAGS